MSSTHHWNLQKYKIWLGDLPGRTPKSLKHTTHHLGWGGVMWLLLSLQYNIIQSLNEHVPFFDMQCKSKGWWDDIDFAPIFLENCLLQTSSRYQVSCLRILRWRSQPTGKCCGFTLSRKVCRHERTKSKHLASKKKHIVMDWAAFGRHKWMWFQDWHMA